MAPEVVWTGHGAAAREMSGSSSYTPGRVVTFELLPLDASWMQEDPRARLNFADANLLVRRSPANMVTYAYPPPQISPYNYSRILSLVRVVVLLSISLAAISSRQFAIVRFESIIHE